MKEKIKMHRLSALALCALILPAASALAADRSVEIINQTGYSIVEFYGSNSGAEAWEEDILGQAILRHGESVTIDFDDSTGHCMFDFKTVFEDGDILVRSGIDVCKIGQFTYE